MTDDFKQASTPIRTSDGWTWEVPAGWENGRTVFGGLTQAALIRAFQHETTADNQHLRTLSAVLCGPLTAGPAHIDVAVLRRGNNTTALTATITSSDVLVTHAFALFGAHRVDDGNWLDLTVPQMEDWREREPAPMGAPLAPVFTEKWDFRPQSGFAFAGSTQRTVSGWSRPRVPGGPWDAALVLAVADSYWPAPFATMTAMRPMATINSQTQFFDSVDGIDPSEPLFYRATSPAAADGYTSETREVWSEDGRLLALNQQTFAIIK